MLTADISPYTPVLITLLGSGGVVGALVALVKLRGDANSQAVSQAQGATEVLTATLQEVAAERDYWRGRFESCHKERSELLAQRLQAGQRPPSDLG